MVEGWSAFLSRLDIDHGPDAMACRHEIFFFRRRNSVVRAIVALLRDVLLLSRCASSSMSQNKRIFAAATLRGSSGIDTLTRATASLAAETVTVLAHPRLKLPDAVSPGHLHLGDIGRAVQSGLRHWPDAIVMSCVARHALWRAAWNRQLRTVPNRSVLLLHNDFDMMSSALLEAAPHLDIACIQHGIPTDEFFPARAPVQVVWGRSSEAAYRANGYEGHCLLDGAGRGKARAMPDIPPRSILLLSQTHTPIYGFDLTPWFDELANALAKSGMPFSILLHPGETGRQGLYTRIANEHVRKPPHPELALAAPACLVIGYSTTALFEAAQAGHYAAGLDWPVKASQTARDLVRPPVLCGDADGVCTLFTALQNDAACSTHIACQERWLLDTFAPPGALEAWIRQCTAS